MHSVVESELNSVARLLADSNLKAYYRFNSGALTTDEKGAYTLTNNNSVGEISGKYGIGANFGNSNTNKTLTTTTAWAINGGTCSISLWVKLNVEIGSGTYYFSGINNGNTNVGYGIWYEYNSGTRRLLFYRVKQNVAIDGVYFPITMGVDNWYHLVITYDAVNIRAYINGSMVGTPVASSGNGTGTTETIGSFGNKLNGIIDDASIWSRALDPDEIKILSGYTTPATEIAKTVWDKHANLKLHMKFDETSGTDVADSSGASHPGVASAASIIANNIGGMFNNKAVFASASSNKITITDHADLKPTGAFTFGCWFKTSTTGAFQYIFQSGSLNTNRAGFQVYINSLNQLAFLLGRNTGTAQGTDWQYTTGTTTVTDGNWHQVVCVCNGTLLLIYLDGNLEASISFAYYAGYEATNYIRVGCKNDAGTDSNFINGSLDDLFLINGTALSAEQIREIYEGRKLGELYPTTGLVGLWHLNGNSKDFSGQENNGIDTSITYDVSKYKQGAIFNSSGDKILMSSSTQFNFERTQAFSISAWIYINSASVSRFIFGKQESSGNYRGYALWHNADNRIFLSLANSPTSMIEVTTPFSTTGKWTHVVATYNGSSAASGVKIYINGSAASLTTASNNLGTNTILNSIVPEIGNRNGAFNFDGSMDEVAVFNRVLSETEIRKIYMKSIGRLQ